MNASGIEMGTGVDLEGQGIIRIPCGNNEEKECVSITPPSIIVKDRGDNK